MVKKCKERKYCDGVLVGVVVGLCAGIFLMLVNAGEPEVVDLSGYVTEEQLIGVVNDVLPPVRYRIEQNSNDIVGLNERLNLMADNVQALSEGREEAIDETFNQVWATEVRGFQGVS